MTELDLAAAHKHFSATCFNTAWDLLDKPQRTPSEDIQMLSLAFASYYHWSQRTDFTPTSHSVSFWQLSRIFAVLGQGDNALHYAELSLHQASHDSVAPFFRAYAHEALARAYKILGDSQQTSAHLAAAEQLADLVTDAENRSLLMTDLKSLA